MVTAIVSVMAGIPVRRDLAMTGEITLRGRVLPIAGLKEKLLAALRGGIKKVLIPERERQGSRRNRGQRQEGLEIVPVSRMDEVLAHAMTRKLEADRAGRDHDHPSGRARRGSGRRGSLDAARALNDRDTGAEATVVVTMPYDLFQLRHIQPTRSKSLRRNLVIPSIRCSISWA